MTAVFPGAVASINATKSDDTDTKSGSDLGISTTTGDHAAHHNQLAEEVVATQTELGTDPSGTFSTVGARLAARLTCRKTADQTFSSTVTPAAVTDLSFPISTTGVDYYFHFYGIYTSAATTNGLRVNISCPTIGTRLAYAANIYGLTAVTSSLIFFSATSGTGGTTGIASTAALAANTDYPFEVWGTLVNPTATGTLALQAANEVSTASGNIIRRGAWGELYIN